MVYLREEEFGRLKNGDVVKKFTWNTDEGVSVSAITYGAIVQSIKLPDKEGTIKDIALGFEDLDSYVNRNTPHLGSLIGRCANRIRDASFQIDGVTFNVAKNIGQHHLHGGVIGFDQVNWTPTVNGTKVTFSYLSKDGEENYPGDLITNATYELTDDNQFIIDYTAVSTKKTVVNLTNHSYLNLAGHDAGSEQLYEHVIIINADKITETKNSIPTGRLTRVGGTPYDLRTAAKVGDVLNKLKNNEMDDNYCVSSHGKEGVNFVSRVTHPPSGRYLEIYSDQPGVQFYTSNYLPAPSESALIGKNGVGYRRHGAFCLETQLYPDAVHNPNFPSAILKPGSIYKHKAVFAFGVEKSFDPVVLPA